MESRLTDDAGSLDEANLQAWVDGQLSPDHHAEVEAWLDRHPAEFARATAYRQQREQLRAWLAPRALEPVPDHLLPHTGRPAHRPAWVSAAARSAAAAVLLLSGAAGGWVLRGFVPDPSVTAVPSVMAAPAVQLTAAAMRAHLAFVPEVRHPVEVPAAQEAHLVTWLSNRLGRPLRVPDLTPFGFRLVGGRLLPGDTVVAAQFMFDDASGTRLTLYLRAEPGGQETGEKTGQGTGQGGTGFELIEHGRVAGFRWFEDGFGYAVLAETGRDRLLQVAEAIDRQLPAPTPTTAPTPTAAPPPTTAPPPTPRTPNKK